MDNTDLVNMIKAGNQKKSGFRIGISMMFYQMIGRVSRKTKQIL